MRSSPSKKSSVSQSLSNASTAGSDPVAGIQQIVSSMPESTALTAPERKIKRQLGRRATGALVVLVASMAEEGGGNVAGVQVDATASRSAQAQAARLRVGARSARSLALRLMDDALTLEAGNAQRALSALAAMEAQARTPEGKHLAPKVLELRTAAKEGARRPPKGTKAKAEAASTAKAAEKAAAKAAKAAEKVSAEGATKSPATTSGGSGGSGGQVTH